MARILDRQKAIALRQQGKTHNEIKQALGISSGTISAWLKNLPLTENQMFELQINQTRRKFLGREKTSITKRLKLQQRLDTCYQLQKETLLPLSKRELFLAGLFLYWGEGGKTERGTLSISNTDPGVLKFVLIWFVNALDIPKNKVQVLLQLYSDMDIAEATDYWSNTLAITYEQFTTPYIKKSLRTDIDYKGYGHGTCMLRTHNTQLKEKVLMSIKAMKDYSSHYIPQL